jgi:predicted transcriptional regulator
MQELWREMPGLQGEKMKLAHNSMTTILSQQRQAQLLAALQEPATSPELARKVGASRKHISRRLRALEACGEVVEVGRMEGRGGAIVWRRAHGI